MAVSVTAMPTAHCTPYLLPASGVLSFSNSAITLTTNVVFQPQCTGSRPQQIATNLGPGTPYYASTVPQIYVIAASTVVAWVLLVMLMITARTSFTGTAGAPVGFSSGHGIIGGATGGNSSIVGVGSRPWLQKVATFTVALGFALASADALQHAAVEYARGYEDGSELRNAVLGTLEIRIMRLVSDIFLWLAQVQTLIRLFPRHKEKVLIKWIGFVLICADTVFASLNVGLVNTLHYDGEFDDAIPALLYLFEFALGLLYAAWVIYYSLTKRRYAYYHPKMKSVSLIALLSLLSVLTPVVFFVTDVSNNDIAGWGDYIRWVGAAAASVVVWEWVERIEALERDERKDGILGREVFDGDEMLDVMPSDDVIWSAPRGQRNQLKRQDDGGNTSDDDSEEWKPSALEKGFGGLARRFKRKREEARPHLPLGRAHSHATTGGQDPSSTEQQAVDEKFQASSISFGALPRPSDRGGIVGHPTPPPNVASPVSRTDTTSAASTVYVVRYHPTIDTPQPVRRQGHIGGDGADEIGPLDPQRPVPESNAQTEMQGNGAGDEAMKEGFDPSESNRPRDEAKNRPPIPGWLSLANPFKRKRSGLPREVQAAATTNQIGEPQPTTTPQPTPRRPLAARLGGLAPGISDRTKDRNASGQPSQQHQDPQVMVIPAPPRGSGRVWTPDEHLATSSSKAIPPAESNSATTSSNDDDDTSAPSSSDLHVPSGTTQVATPLWSTTNSFAGRSVPSSSRPTTAPQQQQQPSAPNAGGSPDRSPKSSEGRQSVASRSSDVVRPESLTPDRSGNGSGSRNSPVVVVPAPSRARKNRSPLATHSEASGSEE